MNANLDATVTEQHKRFVLSFSVNSLCDPRHAALLLCYYVKLKTMFTQLTITTLFLCGSRHTTIHSQLFILITGMFQFYQGTDEYGKTIQMLKEVLCVLVYRKTKQSSEKAIMDG